MSKFKGTLLSTRSLPLGERVIWSSTALIITLFIMFITVNWKLLIHFSAAFQFILITLGLLLFLLFVLVFSRWGEKKLSIDQSGFYISSNFGHIYNHFSFSSGVGVAVGTLLGFSANITVTNGSQSYRFPLRLLSLPLLEKLVTPTLSEAEKVNFTEFLTYNRALFKVQEEDSRSILTLIYWGTIFSLFTYSFIWQRVQHGVSMSVSQLLWSIFTLIAPLFWGVFSSILYRVKLSVFNTISFNKLRFFSAYLAISIYLYYGLLFKSTFVG